MDKIIITSLIYLLMSFPNTGVTAELNIAGSLVNITSRPDGLLVMFDSGVPTICTNTAIPNWLAIKETNKTMVSVALTMWASKKNLASVYVNGTKNPEGYCYVTQLDPTF